MVGFCGNYLALVDLSSQGPGSSPYTVAFGRPALFAFACSLFEAVVAAACYSPRLPSVRVLIYGIDHYNTDCRNIHNRVYTKSR